MVNIYLMLAILILNIAAIGIVYNFIKRLPKKEILVFIAISVAMMYILISIVYWFSGFNVDENVHEASKNFVIFLFVPINVIIFMPYMAAKYYKLRQNKMKKEDFVKKASRMVILLIVVLVIEYFYFGNIQKNIAQISENIENEMKSELEMQNTIKNEISDEIAYTNEVSNEVLTNEMLVQNVEVVNEI